jgi:hypothetical protein
LINFTLNASFFQEKLAVSAERLLIFVLLLLLYL